ncbi:hypothetical protein QOT17_021381 [Balamuthia mandrillaris]
MKQPLYVCLVVAFFVGSVISVAAADEETEAHSGRWVARLGPNTSPESFAEAHGLTYVGPVNDLLSDYHVFLHNPSHKNARTREYTERTISSHPEVKWMQRQVYRTQHKRGIVADTTDPQFNLQWHLKTTHDNHFDINIEEAWDAGYTGTGITVSIVDDGLEWTHPDFLEAGQEREENPRRYISEASYDWNDSDDDPSPALPDDTHGTSCGGLSFAGRNNGKCGIGAAFNASFSAQRLISAQITDDLEAAALGYRTDVNFIYSSSWGPNDDGKRLEGPGPLTRATMERAINEGRNGLGSIYVWAAGNGAGYYDNINYDGYANSRYTIAVAALTDKGTRPVYSEKGSAVLISAPSSPPGLTTTAVHENCRSGFGGTSAAAPLLSGVVAVVLQANPNLGWRDVQDVLIRSAIKTDPDEEGWKLNGAGLPVNHQYGFGRVDTSGAVKLATDPARKNLPSPQKVVTGEYRALPSLLIPFQNNDGINTTITIDEDFCIEHVEVIFRAVHPSRGTLRVTLFAPSGLESILADSHPDNGDNFYDWPFGSVRHWGETSKGTWTLNVVDTSRVAVQGLLNRWKLNIYGHACSS